MSERLKSVGEQIEEFLKKNPPPYEEIEKLAYGIWEARQKGNIAGSAERDWETAKIIWAVNEMKGRIYERNSNR